MGDLSPETYCRSPETCRGWEAYSRGKGLRRHIFIFWPAMISWKLGCLGTLSEFLSEENLFNQEGMFILTKKNLIVKKKKKCNCYLAFILILAFY